MTFGINNTASGGRHGIAMLMFLCSRYNKASPVTKQNIDGECIQFEMPAHGRGNTVSPKENPQATWWIVLLLLYIDELCGYVDVCQSMVPNLPCIAGGQDYIRALPFLLGYRFGFQSVTTRYKQRARGVANALCVCLAHCHYWTLNIINNNITILIISMSSSQQCDSNWHQRLFSIMII